MKKVLILDDDRDLCSVLSQILELMGVERCISVSSLKELQGMGDAALDCEMSILDVNLGVGLPSGLDAYDWLNRNGYKGRIVFFTGHARSHPLVKEALEIPGVGLIEKPIQIDRIEALLR